MPQWEPTAGDISRALLDQNPWLDTGAVPTALAPPTERPLVEGVLQALRRDDVRRFQVVLGPRRVGKTTVMYQVLSRLLASGVPLQQVAWLRLDHPLFVNQPLGDMVRALMGNQGKDGELFLFLDELVYADRWDLWLKTFYDERWPVRVVASSSAVAALRRGHSESGVGRWDERYLTPYLLSEYLGLRNTPVGLEPTGNLAATLEAACSLQTDMQQLAAARRELMLTGGFPELLVALRDSTDEADRLIRSQRVLRADAVERAIYKDIPQSFGVDNPMQLERLLYVCAGQVAQLFSPSNIAGELGIAAPTLERYLTYLERSFVIFMLQNYSGSEASVQRRGRRLYFYDGAVRNAALERGLAPLQNPAELGLLYENLCASHLFSLSLLTQVRCFHWRDGELEVDLIYDDPERPLAFEIASSPHHTRRGLRALLQRYPRFKDRAWVVAAGSPATPPSRSPDGIGQMPLDLFLVATGAELHRRLTEGLR